MHTLRPFRAALILMAAFAFIFVAGQTAQAATDTPAQAAISTLITAPNSPMPAGTKLESVNIADGLATVDFSHQLKDNFHGGDTDEANAVNGILRALGQFPTVNRVQILVAGQPVESLGGMLVISQPLNVIRPAGYADAHRMYFHRRPHAKH